MEVTSVIWGCGDVDDINVLHHLLVGERNIPG